jgi:hypothetical protein
MKLPCPGSQLAGYLARPDITITEQSPWILQEFIKVGATAAAENVDLCGVSVYLPSASVSTGPKELASC